MVVAGVAACSARADTKAPGAGAELPDPPGDTTARTGDAHEFDDFAGGWTTEQRRPKARGVGSDAWEE